MCVCLYSCFFICLSYLLVFSRMISSMMSMNPVVMSETLLQSVHHDPTTLLNTTNLKRPFHRLSSKHLKPKYLLKPFKITYPEDKLRGEFYNDHPFELMNPVVVREERVNECFGLDDGKGGGVVDDGDVKTLKDFGVDDGVVEGER